MIKFALADAIEGLRSSHKDYARLIERNTFDVGFYRPQRIDPQEPHARDELYMIAAGRGDFACDGETKSFAPGDAFLVPAGVEHRFMNFSEDFAAWVVFFGERSK